MKPEISVIIPIYNGYNFIPQIFAQLSKQTYKNFEAIFVDDGSKDESVKRLNKFRASLPIKAKIICENNKGQGEARNTGIFAASGKYIIFMDQDDRIYRDYLEKLYTTAERENADAVISGYCLTTAGGKVIKKVFLPASPWARFMCITPWAKIYRRDFLIKENCFFKPLALGEDIYFNFLVYSKLDKMRKNIPVITDYAGYGWSENPDSFSRTAHKKISEETDIRLLFRALYNAYENAPEMLCKDEYSYFLLKTAIYHILYALPANPAKEVISYKDQVMQEIIKINPNILKNKYIHIGQPKGERWAITFIVKSYAILYQMKLDDMIIALAKLAYFLKHIS